MRSYNYIPETGETFLVTTTGKYTALTMPISLIVEFELSPTVLVRLTSAVYFGTTPWRDDRTGINDFWGPAFAFYPSIGIVL